MKIKDFKDKCVGVQEYWKNRMPMMTMEEAGELIQAISKFEREPDIKRLYELADEIGDMYISLKSLEYYYIDKYDKNISYMVEKRIEEKLNKEY